MPRVSIGDCHLHYERSGAGFPVILVTGLSGVASFWREQVPVLSRAFDVIAFDHRGVGQSDHSRISYTVERLAADVIGLMDVLGVAKAHFVGHSTGGAIAQIIGIEHPARVASLVIAASWTKADAYFRRLFALRREILLRLGPSSYVAASSLFLNAPYFIAQNNEALRQCEAKALATFSPPEIMASRIDAILAFDRTAELNRIRAPTLIVASQDDIVTPAYFSEALARAIPGAEAKFLAQGGHAFPQTSAREFNLAIQPFLAAHTPAETRRQSA